jgi:nucleoid-associated protein YgaU
MSHVAKDTRKAPAKGQAEKAQRKYRHPIYGGSYYKRCLLSAGEIENLYFEIVQGRGDAVLANQEVERRDDMSRSVSPFERYGRFHPETDSLLQEHVFRAGDTLSGLAHLYYGDWRLWRLIADRNQIIDARTIPIGTTLMIPKRPLEYRRYEST